MHNIDSCPNMFRSSCLRKHLQKGALPVMLLLLQVSTKADPVIITSTVSLNGANYLYDFAVTNSSTSDPYSILVNFSFSLPGGSVLGTPVAPAGYGAFADPGSGYVQFSAADLSGFPLGQTVGGFQFLSPTPFPTLSFEAAYLDSTQTTATLFAGSTSPVPSAPVPEPQAAGLLAVAALLVMCGLGASSRNLRN